MRIPAVVLAGLAALAVTPWTGDANAQARPGEPPGAARILLPGRLVTAATVPAGDRRVLAVVLREGTSEEREAGGRDTEPPRRVYVYDPTARTLVPRGGALSGGSPTLAAGTGGALWVGLAGYGRLDLLPMTSEAAAAALELPRRAERTSWGLRLTSPAVHPIPDPVGAPGAPPCFATEPEAQGARRLRILLLCPDRETEEVWALLPGAETVTAAHFDRVDGTPALAVLTREKLGLFVKQAVRVFPLAGSRSRVGTGPVLAERTDCPLWRGSELSFADTDGDGARDLVVACRTGLVDPELRVEVYPHRGPEERGGPFDRRPRVAKLEGDFGSWHHGEDWTGDGVPDLLATRDGLLHVHAGDPRGRPVDGRPSRSLALPGTPDDEEGGRRTEVTVGPPGTEVRQWIGGPTLVAAGDLDGDGRPELVVHRARKDGGELLVLTP